MTDLSPDHHEGRATVSIAELIRDGFALPADAEDLSRVVDTFRMRITPAMRKAAQTAPAVARQFVPSTEELVARPEDMVDPIGDDRFSPVSGLTHRYPDRAILHITKTCDVYCRFCFRRETVGDSGHLSAEKLDAVLTYIKATPSLWEIILTGGDPLVLSPRRLADVMERLAAIPHVEVVRFHTRVPVVAPHRITEALIRALDTRLTPWIVVHTNHADELTAEAEAALQKLSRAGIGLLSQSVLLKGVNDSTDALETLFRKLYRLRVKPYYLHHCDMAKGASHFRTTIAAGQTLIAALRGRLSGPCLPTYILDIPGGYGKSPIGPSYLFEGAKGEWTVADWQGGLHSYSDPSNGN